MAVADCLVDRAHSIRVGTDGLFRVTLSGGFPEYRQPPGPCPIGYDRLNATERLVFDVAAFLCVAVLSYQRDDTAGKVSLAVLRLTGGYDVAACLPNGQQDLCLRV